MKNPIFVILFIILFSCSKEETINFAGIYNGELSCSGDLESENGENLSLVILSTNENNYTIDFGDEVIFQGVEIGNTLNIPDQILNENESFDVIKLKGSIQFISGDQYRFTFDHEVDGYKSSCSFDLTKE
ncbi:MAG TPA: hypothetical protein VK169_20005 [Saprospiraceae bacterium]|nr:hypothetical protein [Saprospiraceae bacterium]